VFEASPETKTWLIEKTGGDQLHPVTSVDQGAFVPTALPIFLRLLEPDDIVDLLLSKLSGRVLLFFDWLRFEAVVARTGCALTWVRPKPIEGKNLHEIIGRKTPRIGHRSGHGLRLGKMFVFQFFSDGLRPSSIAAQWCGDARADGQQYVEVRPNVHAAGVESLFRRVALDGFPDGLRDIPKSCFSDTALSASSSATGLSRSSRAIVRRHESILAVENSCLLAGRQSLVLLAALSEEVLVLPPLADDPLDVVRAVLRAS
jgi:hypothetical protein